MRVGGQNHAPAALPPGKETCYPLYGRMGGPQEPVWTGADNLAQHRGFDVRTVQPVASRYTYYLLL
jgi:hypothetical protein